MDFRRLKRPAANLVVAFISSALLIALLNSLQASGTTDFRTVIIDSFLIIGSYLVSCSFALFILRGKHKEFLLIVATSIVGSILYSVFHLIWILSKDWWYISKNPNDLTDRHLDPQLILFVGTSLIFFLIFGTLKFVLFLIRKRKLSMQ